MQSGSIFPFPLSVTWTQTAQAQLERFRMLYVGTEPPEAYFFAFLEQILDTYLLLAIMGYKISHNPQRYIYLFFRYEKAFWVFLSKAVIFPERSPNGAKQRREN